MTSVEIKNLDVELGKRKILDNLSFNLGAGQIAALLGPSGCGKTTLLRAIAGLIQPSAGTIRFDKQLVSLSSLVLPAHKRKIGYVPQEGALFPHLNVAENIAFGIDRSSLTKVQIKQVVKQMLTLTNLTGLESRMPNQLSGGQQTRVALARALAVKPAIILLDEPFSALDAQLRIELRADVIKLLRSQNTTAILVTHDREEALVSADLVALMQLGRIIQQGKQVCILSLGTRLEECKIAAHQLENKGITTTIVDARFAKPLDEELILSCANKHDMMITIEEGSIGGFGSHVANLLAEKGIFDKGLKFRSMMLPDLFIDQDTPEKMYDVAGLNAKQISKKILDVFFSKEGIKIIK